ncbi:hypothetical protein DITRI_Ditri06bG0133600 [Diplodiscus trichospermus]
MDMALALALALALAVFLELQEDALKRERRKKRRMEKALRAQEVELQEQLRERDMLMKKNQDMLAKEAASKEVEDNFMAFLEAIQNDDPDTAQNFNEAAMMNSVLSLLNGDCGVAAGLASGSNVSNIRVDQKAEMDDTVAIIDCNGSCSSNNEGGTNNTPEIAQNPDQEATKGTDSDDNEGEGGGGFGGSCNGSHRK